MDVTYPTKSTAEPRKTAVIFTGLQASGKSAFYAHNLAATHVRINLDELQTRGKERKLLAECIADGRSFAVDNTNPKREDRARYIKPAKQAGYNVIGMYFVSPVKDCLKRNGMREGKARVPDVAIMAIAAKMEPPTLEEGFDELYYVSTEGGGFYAERKEH